MSERSVEYQNLEAYLESLAEQWGDKLQLYGYLHTATPDEATPEQNLEAHQALVDCFGEEETQKALEIWTTIRRV